MSACPCSEINFLPEPRGGGLRGERAQFLRCIYFSISFFSLLATLSKSAFRQKLTIRSVKRKGDISRGPVNCERCGRVISPRHSHNTKGNFQIGKSQPPSITSLSPKCSTCTFLSLSRLNPTIFPISISSPLPHSSFLTPKSQHLLPPAAISLAGTFFATLSTLLYALVSPFVSTPPIPSPVLPPQYNIDPQI